MTDWMQNIVQKLIYTLERLIAKILWGLDSAGLYVVDIIDRFRSGLVHDGFTIALDEISKNVLGLNRPVFELALVLGLFLTILLPIVPFRWINFRKVLFLGFALPIMLPLIAGAFQDIDAARGELGGTFYNNIYSRMRFNLIPPDAGNGNGQDNDMGPIIPFTARSDGYSSLRGVDVAAAYLYTKRTDVFNPTSDLPEVFKGKYFFREIGEFDDMHEPQRWDQINQSAHGITRMAFGIILIVFAILESLVNLGFTLSLGFLMIALLLSSIFAYFQLFEGIFANVVKHLVDLFLQSWGISAVQALVLGALISIAKNGSSIATLGMGLVALGIQLLFVSVAWKSVISAITGLGTSNSLSGYEGTAAFKTALGATGGVATTVATGVASFGRDTLVGGLKDVKRGHALAKKYGNAITENISSNTMLGMMGGYGLTNMYPINGQSPQVQTSTSNTPAISPRLAHLGIAHTAYQNQFQDVKKLDKALQMYKLPKSVQQVLMKDIRDNGAFSNLRHDAAKDLLMHQYQISEARANRYLSVLEKRMQHVVNPTNAAPVASPPAQANIP